MAEKKCRAGLQKDVAAIFDGVAIPGDTARGAVSDVAGQIDAGPENPMVSPVSRRSKIRLVSEESASRRRFTLAMHWQKVMLALGLIIWMMFAAYYIVTHQAPPLDLVLALFILYLIGLSLGTVYAARTAKVQRSS